MKRKKPKKANLNRDAEDWRRALAKILSKHNNMHASAKKTVSHRTSAARAYGLYRWFHLLREMGFRMAPDNLGGRHIEWLMLYWTCDPRVANLPADRARKITPLKVPLSPGYIQHQLSILRVFAGWIGKPGMVLSAKKYVNDERLVTRHYAAQYDHSWSASVPSAEELIKTVSERNLWVGVQLEMMLAFGLRRKEAIMFRPHVEEVPADALYGEHRSDQNYLAFLHVKRGTKGGRLRFVPIRNEAQKAALAHARQLAPFACSHLGKPGLSLIQSLTLFSNTTVACGITKAELGITPHGLRHEFGNDLFIELTDIPSPIRGGTGFTAEEIRDAYKEVARQLGHGRHGISRAYLGGLAPSTNPIVAEPVAGDESSLTSIPTGPAT